MSVYQTPGVYRQDRFAQAVSALDTGVPVFFGMTERGSDLVAQELTLWEQFIPLFGLPLRAGYLEPAVRGFFANGGARCYVVRLSNPTLLEHGLATIETLEGVDLVCAPDLMALDSAGALPHIATVQAYQAALLAHCSRIGDRMALLDAYPGASVNGVLNQRNGLNSPNGALYHPWLGVPAANQTALRFIPPCGHVAGAYARSDRAVGVYKAPANEVLEGVVDLQSLVVTAEQAQLNQAGVNCIRSFPGRGARIWGARTLSRESAWAYINVRRLVLTLGRWLARAGADMAFEPHSTRLWARMEREIGVYCAQLFERGALRGTTAAEAFYVRCDETTNPPEVRERGEVVTEIGLAPSVPAEFIVVRIIHGSAGVSVVGLNQL